MTGAELKTLTAPLNLKDTAWRWEADGKRTFRLAQGRGDAKVCLTDVDVQ